MRAEAPDSRVETIRRGICWDTAEAVADALVALDSLAADLAEWKQAASDMNRELEESRAAQAADLAASEARGDAEMERAEGLRKRVIVAERALDAYDGKDELLDALARRVDLDALEARHAQTVEALEQARLDFVWQRDFHPFLSSPRNEAVAAIERICAALAAEKRKDEISGKGKT